MRFTQSTSYPDTVDEVITMYPILFYLEQCFGQSVVEGSSTVSVEDQRVSFTGTVRPEPIPAAAARFVKPDLCITFTEKQTANEAGVSSCMSVTVDGVPVPVKTAFTLAGTEESCVHVVTGNVSVRVPLLGGCVEKEAVAHLGCVMERERALTTQWLEGHR